MRPTYFKSDLPSRVDRALEKRREVERLWRVACRAVDARDKRTCRACGKHSDPDALGLLDRGHRHHIIYRSAGGEDASANLITLCSRCHEDEHKNRLRFTCDGTGYECLDADQGLEFWRQDESGWYQVGRESAPHARIRD